MVHTDRHIYDFTILRYYRQCPRFQLGFQGELEKYRSDAGSMRMLMPADAATIAAYR